MTINLADLGRRLKEARIGCGINQEEAAQAIGVPRTAIVHIEVGNRSISTLELADLARLYKRGIKSFFSDAGGEEDVLVALKRVSPDFEDHPELEMEIARFVSICEEGVQLQQILRFPPRSGPPDYDLPQPRSTMDAVEQGERVAEEERHRLGLGENPIPDVADLISKEGVWASGANLPSEISGFFLTHSSIGMVILVNFHHVRARKRFSHAHEFAHALLDRRANNITVSSVSNRTDLPEVRANAFAASFLLPKAWCMVILGTPAKRWTEPPGAVGVRLRDRGDWYPRGSGSKAKRPCFPESHVSRCCQHGATFWRELSGSVLQTEGSGCGQ